MIAKEETLYQDRKGMLQLGGYGIPCYVLNNKERVVSRREFLSFLGITTKNNPVQSLKKSLSFVENKISSSHKNLIEQLSNPIIFKNEKNILTYGYKGILIVDYCSAIMELVRNGFIRATTRKAIAANVLISSLAKIGIIALIDEATGFQKERNPDALRILISQYIEESMRPWLKTFPDEFFFQLDRLYKNKKTTPQSRPMYYGKFINKYIYDPIEHGYVKMELDKKNITSEGKRKARFHQWLTNFGKGQLQIQLGRIIGKMEDCLDIDAFKRKIQHSKDLVIQPELFDTEEY